MRQKIMYVSLRGRVLKVNEKINGLLEKEDRTKHSDGLNQIK